MDYVTLAAGLPRSSRLGFGCGSVMGRVGRDQSLRAVAAALDGGITHFDVARSYGYGEAEALLGEALSGKRDQVLIAGKFGLNAPRAAGALRTLRPLAQKLASNVPGARAMLRSLVGGATRAADRFSVEAASASLDQSLAALKTDYLDILFLHDCAADDLTDELMEFLDRQITIGKIRACGVATGIETVLRLYRVYGGGLVYQFASGMFTSNAERLAGVERQVIGHSPFLGAERLRGRVAPGDVYPLLLAHALAIKEVGVVLCSMLDPQHLKANLDTVERSRFSVEEIIAATAAPAA
jgi:aryl-alcohol dehydrogenase-like predicted oxidoreductase